MSFVLTLPWRSFVLAMRNRDRANKNEIAVFVFSVTTKDFPHDMLLPGLTGSTFTVLAAILARNLPKFETVDTHADFYCLNSSAAGV
jgi:hypothetical protein